MSTVKIGQQWSKTFELPKPPTLMIDQAGNVSGGNQPGEPLFVSDDCGGGTWIVTDICGSIATAILEGPAVSLHLNQELDGLYYVYGAQGKISWFASPGRMVHPTTREDANVTGANPAAYDDSLADPCDDSDIVIQAGDACGNASNVLTYPTIKFGELSIVKEGALYYAVNAIGEVFWEGSAGEPDCSTCNPVGWVLPEDVQCEGYTVNVYDSCGRTAEFVNEAPEITEELLVAQTGTGEFTATNAVGTVTWTASVGILNTVSSNPTHWRRGEGSDPCELTALSLTVVDGCGRTGSWSGDVVNSPLLVMCESDNFHYVTGGLPPYVLINDMGQRTQLYDHRTHVPCEIDGDCPDTLNYIVEDACLTLSPSFTTVIKSSAKKLTIKKSGNCFSASGGKPPYSWEISGGTINANGCVNMAKLCDSATVTVVDSCQNTASASITIARAPVAVGGPGGSGQYSASGGVPPYRYSSTVGSMDPDTGLLDLTGACGSGYVTATDSCNKVSNQFPVKSNNGVWITVASFGNGGSGFHVEYANGTRRKSYSISVCHQGDVSPNDPEQAGLAVSLGRPFEITMWTGIASVSNYSASCGTSFVKSISGLPYVGPWPQQYQGCQCGYGCDGEAVASCYWGGISWGAPYIRCMGYVDQEWRCL